MAFNYDEYLRTNKMPTLWCWGCGDGVILKSFIRAIDKLGWNKDDTCVVSGIVSRPDASEAAPIRPVLLRSISR